LPDSVGIEEKGSCLNLTSLWLLDYALTEASGSNSLCQLVKKKNLACFSSKQMCPESLSSAYS